jgi:ActR/RegA family two-component response regulator
MNIVPARLIVCEARGRWAALLRRELSAEGVRVWETRTLDGCWAELAASPASFAIVELLGDPAEWLDCLACLPRRFPDVRAAIVTDRRWADREWLFREAGAVHFVCSPRRVGTLAQLACRHLARAPLPSQTFAQRVWTGLPWPDRGGGA